MNSWEISSSMNEDHADSGIGRQTLMVCDPLLSTITMKGVGYWSSSTLDLIPSRLELARTVRTLPGKEPTRSVLQRGINHHLMCNKTRAAFIDPVLLFPRPPVLITASQTFSEVVN